jgi:phosphoserine phosphatase
LKLICFDCDSTLSSIEGIDELARIRGREVFSRVEALTTEAMNGMVRMEDVFGLRMEIVRPGSREAMSVGRRYVETVEATAKATVAGLAGMGWTAVIISGGFRQVIRPLADFLGISRVEAVDLYFAEDGTYRGYATDYPTTRTGGKAEVISRLRSEFKPEKVVMVGDGASDMETRPVVDLFIGYGGFVSRDNVRRGSAAFVTSLAAVPALI